MDKLPRSSTSRDEGSMIGNQVKNMTMTFVLNEIIDNRIAKEEICTQVSDILIPGHWQLH